MPGALLRLMITAIAIVVAAYLLPEYLSVGGAGSVLMFAIVLGVLNALIRPILLFFTLPLNLLTLGLFTLVINAIVFWLAAQFPLGVSVTGFLGAFLAALVVGVVSLVLAKATP
ncbi:MAG: phage holin family protein [Chloroflexi bacterium]|nr:phage holin family protein [Chloroflexota bacterium]